MRKRILCTLLALLPVTAGAADVKELNLADGYIISAKGTLDTVLKRGRF